VHAERMARAGHALHEVPRPYAWRDLDERAAIRT